MGYFATIYGRIEGASDPNRNLDSPYPGSLYHHNRCVIQDVPDIDKQYPFLTRHMFSVAVPKLKWDFDRDLLGNQIIHFGARLKLINMHDTTFIDEWLNKFEQHLLDKLVWLNAKIHIEHDILRNTLITYDVEKNSLMKVLEDFQLVGSRVESKLEWKRNPECSNQTFNWTA